MATANPSIPYVKQSDANGSRNCGAACLSMAYGSFGVKATVDEIWPAISKRNGFGSIASTTHLMAKDAIARGFDAVVVQAKHPLRALLACQQRGMRAILNHRLSAQSPAGHYSLLAGLEKNGVLLHDPLAGPNRFLTFDELMQLWEPTTRPSEIMGNMLIAIAPRLEPRPVEVCVSCHLAIPEHAPCPKCEHPVVLRPAAVLACVAERCSSRLWTYVSCPECDCTWAFYGRPDETKPPAKDAGRFDPLDVDQLYTHVDKFLDYVQHIPGASEHEDLQKQIAFVSAQKEPLRMANAEADVARRQRADHVDSLTATAAANRESLKKKQEEAARQSPPLDGDALGMALLRNHGFMN